MPKYRIKTIRDSYHKDSRGTVIRTYGKEQYKDKLMYNGKQIEFVEDVVSKSNLGTTRGIHGDSVNHKLITCLQGNVFIAAVDPISRRHSVFALNDFMGESLLIPPGIATGMSCLSEDCIISYKITAEYDNRKDDILIRWNDPRIKILWPTISLHVSDKDKNIPLLGEREIE